MCVSLKVAFFNLLLSNRFSFLTRIDVSFYILAFNTQKNIYERSTHYFIDWRDSTIHLHCHPYSYPILVLSLFIPLLSVIIWFHRTSNRTKHKNWLIFSFMNILKNWLYSSIESRFFPLVVCSSLSFLFLFLCQKGIYEHACSLFPSFVHCGCSKYDWYAFSYRFSDHFSFSSYWPLWASRGFLHSILVWWRREHGWWMHSHSKQLPPDLFPEYVAISFEIFPFACLYSSILPSSCESPNRFGTK